jgi:DTW domain-containing protein
MLCRNGNLSLMNTPVTTKRQICTRCLRAQSSCICQWVSPLMPSPWLQVLVLQHPLEVGQAKGTGRLLHLSLLGSRLQVGEQFDAATLQACLSAPWDEQGRPVTPVLLYPDTPDAPAQTVQFTADAASGTAYRLVILDATWRKSRKMLYLNPLLQQLPRLALQDPPASHYRIRKAHRPQQLSTLEATCHALAQLDGDGGKYLPLLQAFDGFVGQQAAYVPAPISGAIAAD